MYYNKSIFFMSNLTGADGGVIINKKEAQAA